MLVLKYKKKIVMQTDRQIDRDRQIQTDTDRLKEMIIQSFFQCLVIVFLLIVDIFWHPDQCISHSSYTHIYLHVSPPPSFPNHLPFNFFLFTPSFFLSSHSRFFPESEKVTNSPNGEQRSRWRGHELECEGGD